jgi:hypothetical protein
MNSKTRWILIGGILLLLIFGLWKSKKNRHYQTNERNPNGSAPVTRDSSSNPIGSSGAQQESALSALAFAEAHLTPILFYGKVIDQHGNPVADAEVDYAGNNIPWGGGARQQMKTDAMGKFRIASTGISLSVNVSKENHRSVFRRSDIPPAEAAGDPSSSDSFNYAKLFGSTVHQPDKAHPVIFTLYKSGVLEPLIVDKGKDLIMAKDGTPIRIQMQPGNPKTVIELQCWTDDKSPNTERHYDWRFKMTILAGGMVERRNEIAFYAPETGYDQQVFEYSMAKELPGNQWKYEVKKNFFIRFEDDRYAILDVKMKTGGGHFAVVGFRLNPKPGSRNLETAPPKKPKYR